MGACLKKHVDTFKVIQQLEAGEYSAVIHEIDFQDVNPVGKDASGRTPFGVACKKGQTEVVKHFLDGPHGDRIKELDMSKGLFQNCVGTTNGELIQMLLSKDRAVIADIHYFDPNTIGTCGAASLLSTSTSAQNSQCTLRDVCHGASRGTGTKGRFSRIQRFPQ